MFGNPQRINLFIFVNLKKEVCIPNQCFVFVLFATYKNRNWFACAWFRCSILIVFLRRETKKRFIFELSQIKVKPEQHNANFLVKSCFSFTFTLYANCDLLFVFQWLEKSFEMFHEYLFCHYTTTCFPYLLEGAIFLVCLFNLNVSVALQIFSSTAAAYVPLSLIILLLS